MKNSDSFERIYIYGIPVDFRKGLLSLSSMIASHMDESPFANALFLFFNKYRTSIKAVYWDKTGFAMWVKMLDQEKFPFPKSMGSKVSIQKEQLQWILSGIDPWKLSPHKTLKYEKII